MTADLKNEAQKALDAYDKYESHRDALQFAAAIESLRKAVELQAPAEAHGDLIAAAKRVIAQGGEAWFDEQQLTHESGIGLDDTEAAFVALCSPAAVLAALESQAQPKHTAAQIRAEALEEAARQCEEVKAEAERWARGADTGMYDHQAQGAENCADAIRTFAAATAAQAPAPAQSAAYLTGDGKLHVTAWECHGCGHRGIDDGDDASEACSDCDWRGPCPDEDVCPGCGREETMVSACPKCGDRYYIKAEADIVIPAAAQAPAVGAGDGRQDIGGHIRAAANAKAAQQADDDTRRLDYLQKRQATISLVPDGRDEHGTRHAFMFGGWHCSVNRDVRACIDAAMAESKPPVQGRGS